MTKCIHTALKDLEQSRLVFLKSNLQAFDLKHLGEIEHIYKGRCRLAISLYKNWLKDYEQETDHLALLYGGVDGILLRRQAEDAVQAYWVIRNDFRQALNSYIKRITHYPLSDFKAA